MTTTNDKPLKRSTLKESIRQIERYNTDSMFINLNDLTKHALNYLITPKLYCRFIKLTKDKRAMYKIIVIKYDNHNVHRYSNKFITMNRKDGKYPKYLRIIMDSTKEEYEGHEFYKRYY